MFIAHPDADFRIRRQNMKYKNIKSMLHNFAHSFVSLMNYEDNLIEFYQ